MEIAISGTLILNAMPGKPTNPIASLDLKQIKQIMDLMKRSELTEFAVEEEGFKLKIRRGSNGLPIVSTSRGSNPPFIPAESNSTPPMPVPAPLQSTMGGAPAVT